uniref:Uncharacterized protein n=1 Tax=Thermofilum pendens TaxID=2269 RepID=A0A7J3X847_THEPE
MAAQSSAADRLELGRLAAYLGLALVLSVFVSAVYFAFTYERPPLPGDISRGLWVLVTEALYLLGKVVFLSLALAAAVELLKVGLSARRESERVA